MPTAAPSRSNPTPRPARRGVLALVATLVLAACGGAPAETKADANHDERVAEALDRADRARSRAGSEGTGESGASEEESEAGMTVERPEGAADEEGVGDEDWPTAVSVGGRAGSETAGEETTAAGEHGTEQASAGEKTAAAEKTASHGTTATTAGHGTSSAAEHGAAGAEPATTAPAASGIHWTYEGAEGPDHWAALQGFAACGGQRQSPIELGTRALPAKLSQVTIQWRPATVTLADTGHTMQANVSPGSVTVIDGVPYNLVQVHYHRPSEHTIRGHQLPLEIHFVHKNAAGSIAVLGVLVEMGTANPTLSTLFPAGKATGGASGVSLTSLLPQDLHTYRYLGSLTTPPCTEGVRWLVLSKPVVASEEQIDGLTYEHNARPTQPIGTRLVLTDGGW